MRKTLVNLILIFCLSANNLVFAQNIEDIELKKPLKITGGLGGQSVFYSMKGAADRRSPFSYILSGNLNFNLFNVVNIPLSFTYSEQQRSFQQPFNQIGFSPQYKWLTIHAGYRSIKWGDYTLGGFNFLLGGAEVQTSKFRAGLVYGRMNKYTQPDTFGETSSLLPSYKRLALAAKLGYGNTDNYVDLVFLSAKDHGDSIVTSKYYNELRPSENRVIELATKQRFKSDFIWKAEVALSATNVDKEATGTYSGSGPADFLMKLNNTGGSGAAYNSSLSYRKKSFSIEVGYKHIDQNYKSFGGYYYNANVDNSFANLGYSLFKNKLRVSHSLLTINDNANKKKNITTNRIMPGISFDISASKSFGLTLRYNLVSTKQKVEIDTFTSSSLTKFLLNQKNHMISAIPRITVKSGNTQHVFMLMETYQMNKDANSETKKFAEFTTLFSSFMYSVSFLKTGLSLNASIFQTRLKNYAISQNTSGINGGLSKTLAKQKINLGTNVSYSTNAQSNTINWTINMNWRAGKKHNFTLNTSLINFSQKTSSNSYTEEQARLMYYFTF